MRAARQKTPQLAFHVVASDGPEMGPEFRDDIVDPVHRDTSGWSKALHSVNADRAQRHRGGKGQLRPSQPLLHRPHPERIDPAHG